MERREAATRSGGLGAGGRMRFACVTCGTIPLRTALVWRRKDGTYSCREHAGPESVPAFGAAPARPVWRERER